MAFGGPRPVTVVMDARRDEVYVQGFGIDGSEPAQIVAMKDTAVRAGCHWRLTALPPRYALAEAIARIAVQRRHRPDSPALPRFICAVRMQRRLPIRRR